MPRVCEFYFGKKYIYFKEYPRTFFHILLEIYEKLSFEFEFYLFNKKLLHTTYLHFLDHYSKTCDSVNLVSLATIQDSASPKRTWQFYYSCYSLSRYECTRHRNNVTYIRIHTMYWIKLSCWKIEVVREDNRMYVEKVADNRQYVNSD